MAVIGGKGAADTGRSGTHVAHDRTRDVETPVPEKTKPERQIDVFQIAEE
jgi:hypothetical protein